MPSPTLRLHAALWCAVALVAAGCGRTPEEVPVPTVESLCKSAVGDGPRIGVAYDVGGRNDLGVNDAVFDGLSDAVREFKATCFEGEAADTELESARVDRLRHFADNGATTIIAVGPRYARAVSTVSASYPRIRFALIDAPDNGREYGPNVAQLNFRAEEAAFLAGVVAALRTQTGTVGYVGAPDIEGLESEAPYAAGFQAGVTAADPAVKLLTRKLEVDTPDPGRPDGANKVATALVDAGADVLFGSARVSERALFNAARSAGEDTWVIGVGADQYRTATEDQKPHVLTSVTNGYAKVTLQFLTSVAHGRPLSGVRTFGLSDDAIGWASSGGFLTRPEITSLRTFKARIVAGEIEVPNRLG